MVLVCTRSKNGKVKPPKDDSYNIFLYYRNGDLPKINTENGTYECHFNFGTVLKIKIVRLLDLSQLTQPAFIFPLMNPLIYTEL